MKKVTVILMIVIVAALTQAATIGTDILTGPTSFNGTTDRVDIPAGAGGWDGQFWSSADEFTVTWELDMVASGTPDIREGVMLFGDTSSATPHMQGNKILLIQTDGTLSLGGYSIPRDDGYNVTTFYTTSMAVNDGQSHHIKVIWDITTGLDTGYIYVDGDLGLTLTGFDLNAADADVGISDFTTPGMILGYNEKDGNATVWDPFTGTLSNVEVTLVLPFAFLISPKGGELVNPYPVTVMGEWINIDPNAAGGETYVDVWFGTDPNKTSDAYTKITATPQAISTIELPVTGPGVYYWQVDSYINGNPETVGYGGPGEPNMIEGLVWEFTSSPAEPLFNESLPADIVVATSEDAEFVVEATNPYTDDSTGLSYQWKFSADNVIYTNVPGATAATLTLPGVQASDEGYYYCEVTIDSNGSTLPSGIAVLTLKKALAHWTMDQADFVGGQYVDIVGGHNGEPNSVPTFVPGAGPDAPPSGAANIAPDSDAPVGTWNPSERTGQVTVSAWIKWDGGDLGVSGNDIIRKQDLYGKDTMMWSLRIRDINNGNAGIRFYNASGLTVHPQEVIPPNTWTHVCAVYGSRKARIYINGKLSGTDTWAALGTGTESPIIIGGPGKFPGALDNIMIHNFAMSDEEAASLYYQTSREYVCLYPPELDLNGDCKVDLEDFAMIVNIEDLAIMAQNWLNCGRIPFETCGQ